MRAIGRIKEVELGKEFEKESVTGIKYRSVNVTVYFESGDDVHMCQVFQAIYDGQTIDELLRRRNFFKGARGEMIIRYGVREWQGKNYPKVDIEKWHCDNAQDANVKPEQEQAAQVQANYPQGTNTVQEQVTAAQAPEQGDGMPF